MDYSKIYDDFIKDRKKKEGKICGYFEVHHITPRAFGGTNKKSNLIKLTPEDHIRAHLLLAKIHGGRMWAPIMILCSETGGRIPTKKAIRVAAIARKHHGESMVGKNNSFFGKKHSRKTLEKMIRNKNIYTLIHKDHGEIHGIQKELIKITGLDAAKISAVCLGKIVSASGWFNKDISGGVIEDSEKYKIAWRKKQNKITLFRYNGEKWTGFPVDAPIKTYSLFNGDNQHVDGWFLSEDLMKSYEANKRKSAKIAADARGSINGALNPNADQKIYSWFNWKTGEKIKKKRVEMWKEGYAPKSGITAIFAGRQTKAGEWSLEK